MSKKSNKNVPVLRFSEFEGGWEVSTIEEIASVSSGGTPSRTEPSFWDGDIPWVTTGEMSQTEIFDTTEKITQKGLANSSAKLFKKNTLLIAMYGQGKTRGQVSILRIEATTNQACAAITLKDNCNSEFIYHFLSGEYDRLRLLSNDGSQKNLSAGLIKQYKILLPSIAEQEKIASFLGTIDTRLTQLRRKRELLQTYKRGVMQKIFSQKIRFKLNDGKPFPDWESKKIGDLGNLINGLTGKKAEDFGQGKPYITYKQIFDKSIINLSTCEFVSLTPNENQNCVQKGDIFFTTSSETANEVGFASVLLHELKEEVYLNSFCFALRPNSTQELIPEFAQYLFRSPIFREKMYVLAQGSTRFNLSKSSFVKIKLVIPTPLEQEKIAEFLTAIDRKIEAISQQIDRTEQFKKGLLQKMFI